MTDTNTLSFPDVISALLNAKPLGDFSSDWDHVLANADYAPVAYTRSMVSYQSSYMAERSDKFIDLSLVLYHDNRPVGVWPLNMRYAGGAWSCCSNEGPVYAPLLVKGLAERSGKAVIGSCLDALDALCRMSGQNVWKCVEFVGRGGVDHWHRKIMERGAVIRRVSHDLFVDLSMSLEHIKSNIRKSYKSLLSTGDRLWQSSVLKSVGYDVFAEFRELHCQVAGRSTRSIETWNLQEQAVNKGDAFLVVLRDDKGVMVGGGLFHVSGSEGLYAVGVYDRKLFDRPLGHIVQMKAIEYMKTLGLRWYKLGERFYPSDVINPTEKEISISRFKEGFATHVFLKLFLEAVVQEKNI